jgi:hypothetical protein
MENTNNPSHLSPEVSAKAAPQPVAAPQPETKMFDCPSCGRYTQKVCVDGVWRCGLCFPVAAPQEEQPSAIDCPICAPKPCIGGAHRNAMIEDGVIIPGEPAAVPETPTLDKECRKWAGDGNPIPLYPGMGLRHDGIAAKIAHAVANQPEAAPPDDIGAATMRYKALYERKARELAYLVTSGNPAALEKVVLLLARDDKQKSEESNGK